MRGLHDRPTKYPARGPIGPSHGSDLPKQWKVTAPCAIRRPGLPSRAVEISRRGREAKGSRMAPGGSSFQLTRHARTAHQHRRARTQRGPEPRRRAAAAAGRARGHPRRRRLRRRHHGAARRALPSIIAVRQQRKGKGNALAAGFARATGDIVVMFDADGSADPAEITRFVDALKAGADFAKGTRNTAGGGSADITPVRHVGNRFLNTVFNLGFRTRLQRPLLRLQRVLGRPDPAARPARAQRCPRPAAAGCCGATGSRSRP